MQQTREAYMRLALREAAKAAAIDEVPVGAVVIREGTLILAICTGLCMKLTDPMVDKLFRRFLERQR